MIDKNKQKVDKKMEKNTDLDDAEKELDDDGMDEVIKRPELSADKNVEEHKQEKMQERRRKKMEEVKAAR